jgi:hypothetical protein
LKSHGVEDTKTLAEGLFAGDLGEKKKRRREEKAGKKKLIVSGRCWIQAVSTNTKDICGRLKKKKRRKKHW